MGKLSLEEFLKLVDKSGLVERDELDRALDAWQDTVAVPEAMTAGSLCEYLVRHGLLTAWQCRKLLEGRHRGFFLGRYVLLDHLGSGGMSNVFLAEHVLMRRRVAIKVLPHHRVADAAYLARFQLEGRAIAALDHPNIVAAYDMGSEGRIHFLVMEYVKGRDLQALVSRVGPLDFRTAAHYIAQAAAGLDYAHRTGLVHRDIKPANLLVDRHSTIKILDMGLAKFTAEAPIPGPGGEEPVVGTADYLAPEQATNSQSVDGRADIYALGCTFYFLLTGHPPFTNNTTLEQLAAHQREQPPAVHTDRPDVPEVLAAICGRMMAKSPADRFQAAREVRDALVAWLEAEQAPLPGVPPGDSSAGPNLGARDTDDNLREPSRINPKVDPRGSASDVLMPADEDMVGKMEDVPPLVEPPVVSPPREAPPVAAPPSAATPVRPLEGPRAGRSDEPRIAPTLGPTNVFPERFARRRPARWLWPILLSGLVLGALLMALYAARG